VLKALPCRNDQAENLIFILEEIIVAELMHHILRDQHTGHHAYGQA
jgi:hypothetical protein